MFAVLAPVEINQKAKYIVPVIKPTKAYVTEFEGIDVAVGFNDFNEIKEYLAEGLVNIVGGCCGTTDAYISCFHELLENSFFAHSMTLRHKSILFLADVERNKLSFVCT